MDKLINIIHILICTSNIWITIFLNVQIKYLSMCSETKRDQVTANILFQI